ncbi:MAG TPA: hypothetical protein VD735_03110 [Candidatus Saccharimonadales bacterium]|nr:hypothetical protein [Candidatus Saccharimonadales bacterium]
MILRESFSSLEANSSRGKRWAARFGVVALSTALAVSGVARESYDAVVTTGKEVAAATEYFTSDKPLIPEVDERGAWVGNTDMSNGSAWTAQLEDAVPIPTADMLPEPRNDAIPR